jgi:hypothetical protein
VGEKYFKGRMYRNGRMCRYIVWDGEKTTEACRPRKPSWAPSSKDAFPEHC